jgi:hypothetical protein
MQQGYVLQMLIAVFQVKSNPTAKSVLPLLGHTHSHTPSLITHLGQLMYVQLVTQLLLTQHTCREGVSMKIRTLLQAPFW